MIQRLGAERDECFFWATHQGAELDLLVIRGGRRYGFEFQRSSAPTITKSMRIAMEDLALHSLDVFHAGAHTFPMDRKIRAVAAGRLLQDLEPLR